MNADGYLNDWPVLVAFPHAGGSEMITFICREKKLDHLKTINDYHTRSILSLEMVGNKIWTLDGNGVIFSLPVLS